LTNVGAVPECFRKIRGQNLIVARQKGPIQARRIGNPSQPPRSDAGDAPRDSARTQVSGAIGKQTHEREIHIAESQEAKIVAADGPVQNG
jgi:hypothetical protein